MFLPLNCHFLIYCRSFLLICFVLIKILSKKIKFANKYNWNKTLEKQIINENKWNLSIRLKLLPEDGLEEGLHFNSKYHKKKKAIY